MLRPPLPPSTASTHPTNGYTLVATALASLGVPMVTVLKNLTSLFTLAGDYWLHGRTYGRRVWGTLSLMAASALCGAATDLAFNARGYGWQLANCAATAAYSLALRGVMDRVAGVTAGRKVRGARDGKKREGRGKGRRVAGSWSAWAVSFFAGGCCVCGGRAAAAGTWRDFFFPLSLLSPALTPLFRAPSFPSQRLSELSMVFYNNALAVPILLPLCAANGELGRLWRGGEPALANPAFLAAASASAALAFGISFTSLWFLSTTTATAYSLVGSLNKVPIALLGLCAFGAPATPQNIASIGVGLAASAVFVLAKQAPPPAAKAGGGAGLNGGGGGG